MSMKRAKVLQEGRYTHIILEKSHNDDSVRVYRLNTKGGIENWTPTVGRKWETEREAYGFLEQKGFKIVEQGKPYFLVSAPDYDNSYMFKKTCIFRGGAYNEHRITVDIRADVIRLAEPLQEPISMPAASMEGFASNGDTIKLLWYKRREYRDGEGNTHFEYHLEENTK